MSSTSDTPVLDLLATMTSESLAASSLEGRDLMLVRIAALVAVDAPPSSYLLNAEQPATRASTSNRRAASSRRSPRSSAPRGSLPRRQHRPGARDRARGGRGRSAPRTKPDGERAAFIGLGGRRRVGLPGAPVRERALWNAGHNGRPMRASEEIMDFRSTPQALSHPVAGASPGVRGHLCRRSARRPGV